MRLIFLFFIFLNILSIHAEEVAPNHDENASPRSTRRTNNARREQRTSLEALCQRINESSNSPNVCTPREFQRWVSAVRAATGPEDRAFWMPAMHGALDLAHLPGLAEAVGSRLTPPITSASPEQISQALGFQSNLRAHNLFLETMQNAQRNTRSPASNPAPPSSAPNPQQAGLTALTDLNQWKEACRSSSSNCVYISKQCNAPASIGIQNRLVQTLGISRSAIAPERVYRVGATYVFVDRTIRETCPSVISGSEQWE